MVCVTKFTGGSESLVVVGDISLLGGFLIFLKVAPVIKSCGANKNEGRYCTQKNRGIKPQRLKIKDRNETCVNKSVNRTVVDE